MSLPPSFFEHLDDRLALAVYDINEDHRMGTPYRQILANAFMRKPEPIKAKPMTIADKIKAAKALQQEARAKADAAVGAANNAANIVVGEADKLDKDTAALLAEVAELTNGGPQ